MPPSNAGAADAVQIPLEIQPIAQRLIAKGVGRTVAHKLAQDKPEACLLLEYLPYAPVKTSSGAWLANAIEHEYGPPERYLKAKRQESNAAEAPPKRPIKGQEQGHQAMKKEELVVLYDKTKKTRPEAFMAFQEHLAGVKGRANASPEVSPLNTPPSTWQD